MDRLELDLEKRTGVFYNAIIYDSDNKAYMTAEEVQWLGGNQFILNQCSFTTCNPKNQPGKSVEARLIIDMKILDQANILC